MIRIRLGIVGALVGALLASSVQVVEQWEPRFPDSTRASIESEPGELSVEGCIGLCRQFLKKVGAADASRIPTVSRSEFEGKKVESIDIQFPQEYSFTILAKTGRITRYQNDQLAQIRADQKRNGLLVNRKKAIKNRREALPYLKKAAQAIGFDPSYFLTDLVGIAYPGIVRQMNDFSGVDQIYAIYAPKPYGYYVYGGSNYQLSLDTWNGQIRDLSFYAGDPSIIESHKAILTQKQAFALAKPIMKKKGFRLLNKKLAATVGINPDPRLVYILPNDLFGGPKNYLFDPKGSKPCKLRLAWMFRFENDSIINIDAGNGKVLGGYDHQAWHQEIKSRLGKPNSSHPREIQHVVNPTDH